MDDEITPKNNKVEDIKLSDTYEQDQKKKNPYSEFFTDFITGFSALIVIGLILFIVIPVLLIILKIGAFLIIPISLLGAFIILINCIVGQVYKTVSNQKKIMLMKFYFLLYQEIPNIKIDIGDRRIGDLEMQVWI